MYQPAINQKRGMTLVELLVGFTLAVLLLGLAYQFLVPALKISSRTTLRAESQQGGTLALRQMVGEMERSNLFGISFSPGVPAVAVHPVEEVTPTGERVYADHLIVYKFDKASGVIKRFRWRNGSDPSVDGPRKLTPTELTQAENYAVDGRVVARNVEDFEFTHSGSGTLVQMPLLARIKMREQTESGMRSFELIRTVSLRNQL